jgi:hypothetical protein
MSEKDVIKETRPRMEGAVEDKALITFSLPPR